jgi:dienelactone hydrolase
MAALARHPEEFAVGVNLYGVTNWIRTLGEWATQRPWSAAGLEPFYAAMGDPVADRERLRRISPLFHADRITKPFLVLHGARDPRVLQIESDEIVAAARANDVPVEYIVFPDEGHGFVRKENRIRAYEAILSFLERHLRYGAPAVDGRAQAPMGGPETRASSYSGPIIDMHLHSYTDQDVWGPVRFLGLHEETIARHHAMAGQAGGGR